MIVRSGFNTVDMNKVKLRKFMRNVAICKDKLKHEQNHLLEMLIKKINTINPDCVGLFSPLDDEINLDDVFSKIKAKIAYPRMDNETLTFHEVKSLNELSNISQYGVLEPPFSANKVVPDIVIVPGLAFSKNGQRLGRGKGYYDRYLSKNITFTISVAFQFQLFDEIPTEEHDVKIDMVLWVNHV